ncbi:hypothetical protein F5X99DRAFT_175792 [Biscogniauxia marginata]|nr:hypothetical protein F5X99DRAFT_175792 [Biscogniauxia marginata]
MDNLPQEIVSIIVSFLPTPGLSPFATLSTKWQEAVERRTFSRLAISSEDEEMQNFARTVTPTRRAHLRTLTFTVVVPFDEGGAKPRSQRQARFSEAFTGAVQRLFQVLAGGDSDDGGAAGMTLELGWVTSARDYQDGREPRYLRQRIGLVNGGRQLPVVKCVSRLVLCVDRAARRVAPHVAVDLAARLPCLKSINVVATMEMGGMNEDEAAMHVDDRLALADTLRETGFLSDLPCREVSLSLEDQDPNVLGMKRRFVFPDCMNSLPYEPLGAAMRMWSQNLVALNLCGVFDGSLFWPGEADPLAMPEFPWPCLRKFNVRLGLSTPTGAWYFTLKPGTKYRNVPCEDTIQPLFESWAKGLECMPVLEQAAILFQVELEITQSGFASETSVENWSVGIQAPDIVPDLVHHAWGRNILADDLRSPRLAFRNVGTWRPWKPTMEKLHALGKDRFRSMNMIELEVDMFDKVTKT